MKWFAWWMLLACFSTAALADEHDAAQELSAAQIVEKNVAARGGLEAWRKIQTMVWVGHIESANAPAPNLPFVLELKRPDKARFEIKAQNQVTAHIYDGTHGWKLRPSRSGQPELQPYTPAELSFAKNGPGLDGPLMDYQAKGVAVTLDGIDEVEGHKAYRLSVKLASGVSHHVWIDAHNFLDIKYDRESRNTLGLSGTLSVYYRNYRTIEGLQIPHLIESGAGTGKATDKMVIDRILLNLPLEDLVFAKPGMPGRRKTVSAESGSRQAVRQTPSGPKELPQLYPPTVSGSLGTQ